MIDKFYDRAMRTFSEEYRRTKGAEPSIDPKTVETIARLVDAAFFSLNGKKISPAELTMGTAIALGAILHEMDADSGPTATTSDLEYLMLIASGAIASSYTGQAIKAADVTAAKLIKRAREKTNG